jgi:cytochrome P450
MSLTVNMRSSDVTLDDQAVSDLPVFPMARTTPFDPPAQFATLAAQGPVVRGVTPIGQPVWLITGHEHVRRILADPRISSSQRQPGYPTFNEVTAEMRAAQPSFSEALLNSDPPEHTDRRRMLITEFTVRRVQALRPRIQEIVDERIDAMLAGDQPADLFAELALPVPSLVICELLGVPYEDRAFFQTRTKALLSHETPPLERRDAINELLQYFDQLVSAKQAYPTDDLLGRLIEHNRVAEVFSHELLVGLATLLLIAGHETTSNVISLGTLALLQNPEQLAALRADESLVPGAVEELLRYVSIVEAGFRTATEDIEIDGTVIKAGEGVIALAGSANRDKAAFDQPDELNIARGARHHVSFGYGIHQCLGQNLARMELDIVFRTLFRRIPGLRMAVPMADVPFKDDSVIYGVHALPVTW